MNLVTGPDLCGHEMTNGNGIVFSCVRPDHGWHSRDGEALAAKRRRDGSIPGTDRHVFRRKQPITKGITE